MFIHPTDRVKLRRALERRIPGVPERAGRELLLVMLSLLYDLEELGRRMDAQGLEKSREPMEERREEASRSAGEESGPSCEASQDELYVLQEENRRLRALMDGLLGHVRIFPTGMPETIQ